MIVAQGVEPVPAFKERDPVRRGDALEENAAVGRAHARQQPPEPGVALPQEQVHIFGGHQRQVVLGRDPLVLLGGIAIPKADEADDAVLDDIHRRDLAAHHIFLRHDLTAGGLPYRQRHGLPQLRLIGADRHAHTAAAIPGLDDERIPQRPQLVLSQVRRDRVALRHVDARLFAVLLEKHLVEVQPQLLLRRIKRLSAQGAKLLCPFQVKLMHAGEDTVHALVPDALRQALHLRRADVPVFVRHELGR